MPSFPEGILLDTKTGFSNLLYHFRQPAFLADKSWLAAPSHTTGTMAAAARYLLTVTGSLGVLTRFPFTRSRGTKIQSLLYIH